MDGIDHVEAIAEEAASTNERRLVVISGPESIGLEALGALLDRIPVAPSETTAVDIDLDLPCEQLDHDEAATLLGQSRSLIVIGVHKRLRPNTIGQLCGVIDGGGLLVMLAPSIDDWRKRPNEFDRSLVVEPYDLDDVTQIYRDRFIDTLFEHPGIAIFDVTADKWVRDGLTGRIPFTCATGYDVPVDRAFSDHAYDRCLSGDQRAGLARLEALRSDGVAAIVTADRGRGKSSLIGLAAAELAVGGDHVLVTAAAYRHVKACFDRAIELFEDHGVPVSTPAKGRHIDIDDAGSIRFLTPRTATEAVNSRSPPDVVIVDEAAMVPVERLESLLSVGRLAFATTVHGYEGTGRGFELRFRDRLDAAIDNVVSITLSEPIRYAPGDPLEIWSFRALSLDARPVHGSLLDGLTLDSLEYMSIDPDRLRRDETRLRTVMGLLVEGHYRTEPDDVARILDAPNLIRRGLTYNGQVVAVAVLAREGGLSDRTREALLNGDRIPGHMIPDVLTSQLRDEAAASPVGYRIMRIATHPAVRSRGIGSMLLSNIHGEFDDTVDWFGAGFGVTERLLSFWHRNGYRPIHCSTRRNDRSGKYSVIVIRPSSGIGIELLDRHAAWFAGRFGSLCADTISDIDPSIVRGLLETMATSAPLELTEHEWTLVGAAAYGTGLYDVNPRPVRDVLVHTLSEDLKAVDLTDRELALLIRRVLLREPWSAVADSLEFESTRQAMRAFGDALAAVVDVVAPEWLRSTTIARDE